MSRLHLKECLLYLWQFPQNICGIIYRYYTKASYDQTIENTKIYKTNNTNVSLGKYVFVSKYSTEFTLKHEVGHTIQSKYLGPLYLLIIGIPSVCWLLYRRTFCPHINYYWFYTESWANKLMNL